MADDKEFGSLHLEGHDPNHPPSIVREFEHRDHLVRIETHHVITIDGQPFIAHIQLDEDGQAGTHALPYESFASLTDLIRRLIDVYPDDFKAGGSHGHT